jgi:hypothetical protein
MLLLVGVVAVSLASWNGVAMEMRRTGDHDVEGLPGWERTNDTLPLLVIWTRDVLEAA